MNFPAMTKKPSMLAAVGKTFSITLLSAALALPTYAQKTTELGKGGGGSPHVKTEWVVAPANIAIEYGRPSIKGRDQETLMPAGKEWRTGADAASIITTDKALKFGDITLQPGTYTINTVPGAKDWQIVFGKLGKAGQWGVPYLKDLEIGRAPMKLTEKPMIAGANGAKVVPVEMVTFLIEPGKSAGTLKIEWGTKSASIPFTVLP